MILSSVLILVLATQNDAAIRLASTRVPQGLDADVLKRTAELARLIHLSQRMKTKREKSHEPMPFDLDYFNMDDIGSQVRQETQKNVQSKDIPIRLYIIRNNVLTEYKKKMGKSRSSDGISILNNGNKFKDVLFDLRRNAVFRLDSSSMEKSLPPEKDFAAANPESIEKIIVYTNTKKSLNNNIKKGTGDGDDNYDSYKDDDDGERKNLGDEQKDLKQDSPWDVITKKYEWDKKENDDKAREKQKLKQFSGGGYKTDENHKLKNINNGGYKIEENQKLKNNYNGGYKTEENQKLKKLKNGVYTTEDWNKLTTDDWSNKSLKRWDSGDKHIIKHGDSESKWDSKMTKMTKKWKAPKRKREQYVPETAYYSKPKLRESHRENGMFMGRTSIPFVGKKGIYAD